MKFAILYLPMTQQYSVGVQFTTSLRWREVGPKFDSFQAASIYLSSIKPKE